MGSDHAQEQLDQPRITPSTTRQMVTTADMASDTANTALHPSQKSLVFPINFYLRKRIASPVLLRSS